MLASNATVAEEVVRTQELFEAAKAGQKRKIAAERAVLAAAGITAAAIDSALLAPLTAPEPARPRMAPVGAAASPEEHLVQLRALRDLFVARLEWKRRCTEAALAALAALKPPAAVAATAAADTEAAAAGASGQSMNGTLAVALQTSSSSSRSKNGDIGGGGGSAVTETTVPSLADLKQRLARIPSGSPEASRCALASPATPTTPAAGAGSDSDSLA